MRALTGLKTILTILILGLGNTSVFAIETGQHHQKSNVLIGTDSALVLPAMQGMLSICHSDLLCSEQFLADQRPYPTNRSLFLATKLYHVAVFRNYELSNIDPPPPKKRP